MVGAFCSVKLSSGFATPTWQWGFCHIPLQCVCGGGVFAWNWAEGSYSIGSSADTRSPCSVSGNPAFPLQPCMTQPPLFGGVSLWTEFLVGSGAAGTGGGKKNSHLHKLHSTHATIRCYPRNLPFAAFLGIANFGHQTKEPIISFRTPGLSSHKGHKALIFRRWIGTHRFTA